MKILYFLDQGKGVGGAANTIMLQAVMAKRAGCGIKVYVSCDGAINEEYSIVCNKYNITLEFLSYSVSANPEEVNLIQVFCNYEEVKKEIINQHPDVIHSVQLNSLVELISRELNIPHIMNIYPLNPAFFNLNYSNIFPHYHICDSEYWAKKWKFYINTDYRCIRTIVEKKNRLNKKKVSDRIRFICVGAVYDEKNQLEVIKAVKKAIDSGENVILDLYGYDSSAYAIECNKYIHDNNLCNKIILRGFSTDMETIYQSYDVLICGSRRESYPNAISEALANNLVVISTPVGGIPEVIKDRYNGYLTDGYTSEDIYVKIMEYINDVRNGNVEVVRENSIETYNKVHSPEVGQAQLMNFYWYVMSDNKHGSDILISDLREEFKEELTIYKEKFSVMRFSQAVSEKIWYVHYAKPILREAVLNNKKIYIWGTGKKCDEVEELIALFLPEIEISGYIDSKNEGIRNKLTIFKPEQIINNSNNIIIVAVLNGQRDVIKSLDLCGRVCNIDYFILTRRIW